MNVVLLAVETADNYVQVIYGGAITTGPSIGTSADPAIFSSDTTWYTSNKVSNLMNTNNYGGRGANDLLNEFLTYSLGVNQYFDFEIGIYSLSAGTL